MNAARLSTYLDQMKSAVSDALDYLDGYEEEQFYTDKRTRQAVTLCLFMIGETAVKIMDQYPEFASSHEDFSWRDMRGMRNRIAHRYFEIDFSVVCKTVKDELPKLAKALLEVKEAPG